MYLQVLYGTGLLGVFLSVGVYLCPQACPDLQKCLGLAVRITLCVALVLLAIVFLDSFFDFTPTMQRYLTLAGSRIRELLPNIAGAF
jgi:hypothetical protein